LTVGLDRVKLKTGKYFQVHQFSMYDAILYFSEFLAYFQSLI